MVRKTQGNVTVNSKLSAVNIQKIALATTDTYGEGAPIVIDATSGGAATPTATAAFSPNAPVPRPVFINWVDSGRSDVSFVQGDPMDSTAPSVNVASGGLAVIVGNGVDIGLPASMWGAGKAAAGVLPAVGSVVAVSTDGRMWRGLSPTANRKYHGVVYRHYNGRAHFLFHSTPFVVHAS